MNKAGWVLIIVGGVLVVIRSLADLWILLKPKKEGDEAAGIAALAGVDLSLKDLADLLKAPNGAGIALVITGAVLLLAGSGVDVSLGGTVSTPTPTPSAS